MKARRVDVFEENLSTFRSLSTLVSKIPADSLANHPSHIGCVLVDTQSRACDYRDAVD